MENFRRGNHSGSKSFAEIQAEQEREQHQQQQYQGGRQNNSFGRYGGGGGGGGSSFHRSSGGGGGGFHNRRGGGGNRRPSRANLPLEQGVICSLKENFGFIHCADREAEIFFHYSEVKNRHPDDLQVDDEVEFRVGASAKDGDKMAAYEVISIPNGTIQWETEDSPGQRFQGFVARPLRSERGNTMPMGNIRYTMEDQKQHQRKKKNASEEEEENPTTTTTTTEEPGKKNNGNTLLVKFRDVDYDPEEQISTRSSSNNKSNDHRGDPTPSRLFRGDLVEFSIVTEKRSGTKFASRIFLVQSERERLRMAKEKKMLEDATLEQGVVVSLKSDFGFLQSNRRKDQIYFHYSNIVLEENNDDNDNDGEGNGEEDEKGIDLTVGQEMQFLVVTDPGDGNGREKPRTSARKLKFLPKGTVLFSKVLAEGVAGYVTLVPPATDSPGAKCGSVRLLHPVQDFLLPQLSKDEYDTGGSTKQHQKQPQEILATEEEEEEEENKAKMVQTVLLAGGDSPGGFFLSKGGSSMGLWIREGDKLLFDVVKDFVDGCCYARPTKYLVPKTDAGGTPDDQGTVTAAEEKEEGKIVEEKRGRKPSVRLIALSLAGRAEGIINNVKEAYGFIHFVERPVDVHFKMFEILPEDIQMDLRRNMGLVPTSGGASPSIKLVPGTEVQFDLSVQGTVLTQSHSRGGGGGKGKHHHERENLKAQRLLFLPPQSIVQTKILATTIRAKVTKEDQNQPYVGAIEFERELEAMTMDERHPLVAKMIDSFLQQNSSTNLVFHDIQSAREDDIVLSMLETKGKGLLTYSHIPQASNTSYPGRLCLRKGNDGVGNNSNNNKKDDSDNHKKEEENNAAVQGEDGGGVETVKGKPAATEEGLPQQERSRSKSPMTGGGRRRRKQNANKEKYRVKTIRFDKASLSQDAKTDVPPGVGDIVTCEVIQIRRTGNIQIHNMVVVERGEGGDDEAVSTSSTGIGVVKEVAASKKFGFISVLDENASKRELLLFQMTSVVTARGGKKVGGSNSNDGGGTTMIRKGDEVKFTIGRENGKRVAVDVEVVTKGGIVPSKVDKNACTGYVLLEPTDTKIPGSGGNRSRAFTSKSRGGEANSSSSGGGGANNSRWANMKEEDDTNKQEEFYEGCILLVKDPSNMFDSKVLTHLHYKNGAIAIHGAGAPSTLDGSTNPRRGDMISFVRATSGAAAGGGGGGTTTHAKDIRVVTRAAANLVRGNLEEIDQEAQTAKFMLAGGQEYTIHLKEVVSCAPNILKDKTPVEGILHDGGVYGICRTCDLKLESKLGTGRKERTKLNLTVKKDRAGKIMAQSMMAKGPDGTTGFAAGWTQRSSKYTNGTLDLSVTAVVEEEQQHAIE